jgi:hypothetical protein
MRRPLEAPDIQCSECKRTVDEFHGRSRSAGASGRTAAASSCRSVRTAPGASSRTMLVLPSHRLALSVAFLSRHETDTL